MKELPRYSMWLPAFGAPASARPSLLSRLLAVLRRSLEERLSDSAR